jgi:hypothetical protein
MPRSCGSSFHIQQRERKPHIHHHGQADDLGARLKVTKWGNVLPSCDANCSPYPPQEVSSDSAVSRDQRQLSSRSTYQGSWIFQTYSKSGSSSGTSSNNGARRRCPRSLTFCMKLLGQRLSARDFDRQVAEIQIRAAILNGFTALGMPRTVAVG